jgi:dUTP pyrophosphatase
MKKEYTLRVIANNSEIENMYKNHSHYNVGDSGIDLFCIENIQIKNGESAKILFGISCELLCVDVKDDGNKSEPYNVSYLLLPRSSIIKTPLRLANSVGLIDAHYQNNICGFVDNIKREGHFDVIKGSRLFQLVTPDLTPFKSLEVVKEFTKPELNRKGGYGSTGK